MSKNSRICFIIVIIIGEGEATTVGLPVTYSPSRHMPFQWQVEEEGEGAPLPCPLPCQPCPPKAALAGGHIVTTPLAKTMAADMGIDISTIVKTRPDGRITTTNVQNTAL